MQSVHQSTKFSLNLHFDFMSFVSERSRRSTPSKVTSWSFTTRRPTTVDCTRTTSPTSTASRRAALGWRSCRFHFRQWTSSQRRKSTTLRSSSSASCWLPSSSLWPSASRSHVWTGRGRMSSFSRGVRSTRCRPSLFLSMSSGNLPAKSEKFDLVGSHL